MEEQVKMLENLATSQCVFFKKIQNKSLQIKIILNEISCLNAFISKLNPTALPQNDVRYRAYVLQVLNEFANDIEIFKAILIGR